MYKEVENDEEMAWCAADGLLYVYLLCNGGGSRCSRSEHESFANPIHRAAGGQCDHQRHKSVRGTAGPDGSVLSQRKIIEEFGTPTLEAGETRIWEGTWTVTEEQLKQGRVIFAIQYLAKEADGSSSRKTQPYYVPVVWTEPKPQQVKIVLGGNQTLDTAGIGALVTGGSSWILPVRSRNWEMLVTR